MLAFDGEKLVLVTAVGDLEAVLALAREHLPSAVKAFHGRSYLTAAVGLRFRKAP